MKLVLLRFFRLPIRPIVALLLILFFWLNLSAKKIYIGTGTGTINYPNAQASLNLQGGDTLIIKAGTYSTLVLKNVKANAGSKIYILNEGLVEFANEWICFDISDWQNVEMKGNTDPNIEYGFQIRNMYRAFSMTGTFTGVTFSHFKITNITEYGIYLRNGQLVYDGTDNPNSIFYDLKFIKFYAHTIKQTFLQIGDFTTLASGFKGMVRKLEVAYCHIENITDNAEILRLSKVVEANIHHNRIINTGFNDTRHAGIIFLQGNGDVHHNYFNNNWGNAVRGEGFGLNNVGELRVYNNIVLNGRKYSGVEANSLLDDVSAAPYGRYCNYKIYNNTFGNLSAVDWQASMVETYNAQGGTILIKNNLGFNIERDKPHNPAQNYVYRTLNATIPDTVGNRYSRNFTDLGIASDDSCMLLPASVAIDNGVNLAPLIIDDINGTIRPQNNAYDIGAREYSTGVVFPVASAGADQTITLPNNTVSVNGSASYDPNGGNLIYAWSKISGPPSFSITGTTLATANLSNLAQGVYELKLVVTNAKGLSSEDRVLVTVNPAATPAPIANAGADQILTLPNNTTNLNGGGSSNPAGGALTYAWSTITGPLGLIITGINSVTPTVGNLTQGVYELKLVVTNSNGVSAEDRVLITVNAASPTAPVANAGPDQTIILPTNTISLNGGSSYNSAGGNLTYAWSKLSGPSSFVLSNASSSIVAISSLVQGVYEFSLTVTNAQGLTNEDRVLISVNTPSAVTPVANAGPDQTITLPTRSADLDGSASYNPAGGGGLVTYEWTKISGPIAFAINNLNIPSPTISLLDQGVYELKLRVVNNQGVVAEDIVQITVNAPTVVLPYADAGTDTIIQFPSNGTTLSGKGSYTNNNSVLVGYKWKQLSGPTNANLANNTAVETMASNLEPGEYVFQLQVQDSKGRSAADTVVVLVVSTFSVDKQLTLYPNPCTQSISVRIVSKIKTRIEINIVNTSGIVMFSKIFNKNQLQYTPVLNVANFPSGMYVVEVSTTSGVLFQQKFLKQ
jgi:hypothetical protein